MAGETAVIEAVAAALQLSPDRLRPSTRSEDVEEWDSLGHLRVCMAIEEQFGVSIDIERIPELDSIAALVEFLGDG